MQKSKSTSNILWFGFLNEVNQSEKKRNQMIYLIKINSFSIYNQKIFYFLKKVFTSLFIVPLFFSLIISVNFYNNSVDKQIDMSLFKIQSRISFPTFFPVKFEMLPSKYLHFTLVITWYLVNIRLNHDKERTVLLDQHNRFGFKLTKWENFFLFF